MIRALMVMAFLMIYTVSGFSGGGLDCCEEKTAMLDTNKIKESSCHQMATGHVQENKQQNKRKKGDSKCLVKQCCFSYFSFIVDHNKIPGPYYYNKTLYVSYLPLDPLPFRAEILRPPIFSKS